MGDRANRDGDLASRSCPHWQNVDYTEVENLCMPFADDRRDIVQTFGISVS
jgi:hypothetical protein